MKTKPVENASGSSARGKAAGQQAEKGERGGRKGGRGTQTAKRWKEGGAHIGLEENNSVFVHA